MSHFKTAEKGAAEGKASGVTDGFAEVRRDPQRELDAFHLRGIASQALSGSLDAAREFFNGYHGYLGAAVEAFEKEPNVIKLSAKERPVLFVGDIHGDAYTLGKIMGAYPPKDYTYVMLGDYVDRGQQGVEVLTALLATKLLHPDTFIMLRGNHESPEWKRQSGGFPVEFMRKTGGRKLDRVYLDLFPKMPLAAVVDGEYFAVHGGIPGGTTRISEIASLDRSEGERNPLIMGMLWNDFWEGPESSGNSRRGDGIRFIGANDVDRFCLENGVRMIIRGHQNTHEGYKAGKKVLTLLTTTSGANRHQRVALLKTEPEARLKLIDVGGRKPETVSKQTIFD
jgi:diadenosine tetraphosphatase ApaH/serine/threonine PP2A family protein phosphatase